MSFKSLHRLLAMALILAMVVLYAPVRADDDIITAQTEEMEAETVVGNENVPDPAEEPSNGNTGEEENQEPAEITGEETEGSREDSGEYFSENAQKISSEEENEPVDPTEETAIKSGSETVTYPIEEPIAKEDIIETDSTGESTAASPADAEPDIAEMSISEAEETNAIAPIEEASSVPANNAVPVNEEEALTNAEDESEATVDEATSLNDEDATETGDPAESVVVESTIEEYGNLKDNSASTIEEYIRRALYGPSKAMRGTVAYYALTENEKRLYNGLKPIITQLAAGERSSSEISIPVSDIYDNVWLTAEELGVECLTYIDDEGRKRINSNALSAYRGRFPLTFQNVLDALLFDLPFDLYWQDKTISTKYTGSALTVVDNRMGTVFSYDGSPAMITVRFPVSQDYSVKGERGTYVLDTGYGGSVQAAVANAKRIVAQNAGKSDLQKLRAYADTICELTDYNYNAAGTGGQKYGNPWQIIWVFDGDPETKVVCEGYAKAFLYLCDKSSFSSGIETITVSGDNHMWDLVTLDDGYQYLVDVTWMDTSGADLFMRGYTKKVSDLTYIYKIGERSYTYVFDEPTYNLFHETGHLDLSCWEISDGILTILAEIPNADQYTSAEDVPWTAQLNEIQEVVVNDSVSSIGNYILAGLTLQKLTLSSSVKSISDGALADTTVDQVLIEKCSAYLIAWAEENDLNYSVLNHELTEHERVEPTLASPGYEAYWSCETCGKLFSDAECKNEIDAPIRLYLVTFDVNGGTSEIDDQIVQYQQVVEKPEDPAQAGYTFDEWFWEVDGEEKLYDFDNPVIKPIHLVAHWLQNSCVITFVVNDEVIDEVLVAELAMIKTIDPPIAPLAEDEVFLGWYLQFADGSLADESTDFDTCEDIIDGDMTFVGKLEEVPDLAGIRMNLEGKIQMIVRFTLPEDLKDAGYSVKLGDQATIPFSEKEYDPSTDSYYFKCYLLAPEYDQEIEISIVDAEGNNVPFLYKDEEEPYDVFPYSLKQYIQNMKQKTEGDQLALIEALDAYCKAAKHRFLGGDPIIVSADMSSVKDTVKPETLPEGITSITRSLSYEEDNTLRFRVYLEQAGTEDNYTFTIPTGATKTVIDNKVIIALRNIAAPNLNIRYTVSVSDGTVTATTIASPLSYLKGVIGKYADGTDQLSYALYNYWQAAYRYFNK